MTAPVPVLLVTGPVGVGKTVVTGEAARLLSEAGIPHAMADLAGDDGLAYPDRPGHQQDRHRSSHTVLRGRSSR